MESSTNMQCGYKNQLCWPLSAYYNLDFEPIVLRLKYIIPINSNYQTILSLNPSAILVISFSRIFVSPKSSHQGHPSLPFHFPSSRDSRPGGRVGARGPPSFYCLFTAALEKASDQYTAN
jgi:hypothetical protein